MQEILSSLRPVIEHPQFVTFDGVATQRFVDLLTAADFAGHARTHESMPASFTEQDYVGFTVVSSAINFCFWGSPKWTIDVDGQKHDGSYALYQALFRALREDYRLHDPHYLETIPESDFAHILRGTLEIPLFAERLAILRSLGKRMRERFAGDWMQVLAQGNYDAPEIVRVLVREMPDIWNDEIDFEGNKVRFFKRVQLVPAYVSSEISHIDLLQKKITNLASLDAPADYKLPQMLRKFGVMNYSPDLAARVDSLTEIPQGSREETEIRAFTIESVRRMTELAQKLFPGAHAMKVHEILWLKSQNPEPGDKPYHRTRTIWY